MASYSFARLVQLTLFGSSPTLPLSDEAKAEARQQAVYALVSASGDDEAMQIISHNLYVAWEQQELTNTLKTNSIPFVVLKGLAAAMYYPEPMIRALGDIDIIVDPADFLSTYSVMLANGYTTADSEDKQGRHIAFRKNGVLIELHRCYASLNTVNADRILDAWIYQAIPHSTITCVGSFSFPRLAEPLNGITLLCHISQHLEEGLGIRQIIDWVMYVSRELPDEKWPAFQKMTDQIGLTKLTKTVARFGQLYLGLPEESHSWCKDADDAVCADLADYIFECGNFGQKAGLNNTVAMVLSHGSGIKGFFQNLQQCGERNWRAYQKHHWLKPVCWLYQAFRYARFGLRRENAFANLKKDYISSKKRNSLMRALGATRQVERM